MEAERVKWNAFGFVILAAILTLASPLYGQKDTGPAADQADGVALERAREYFSQHNLDEAERICERLANKGGPVGTEAQAILNQIIAWRGCQSDANSLVRLSLHGECQQATQILQGIKQRCPGYPGLEASEARCASLPPTPAPAPELGEGEKLFKKGALRQALEFFESKQPTYPNSAELQSWIQKTKVEQLVREIEASCRGSNLTGAKEQLARLVELAPEDDRIPKLRAKLQALPGARPTGKEEGRVSGQDALLEDAIREFYAGNLSHADQLLEQYVGQPASHKKALAYFYRGAIVCNDYFLTGAKDEQKGARAREFFSRARQADGKFTPSRDWIPPKIIEIYERTATGS